MRCGWPPDWICLLVAMSCFGFHSEYYAVLTVLMRSGRQMDPVRRLCIADADLPGPTADSIDLS